jgi:hypothetical protein
MEPAAILVTVLVAGAAALLIWLGVSSRRSEARNEQTSTIVHQEPIPHKANEYREMNERKTAQS